MKDCAGRKLEVGQRVATNVAGYLDELVVCEIIDFTPHKVKLKRVFKYKGDENIEIFLKNPRQLCIV